jgi:hypothetical protein
MMYDKESQGTKTEIWQGIGLLLKRVTSQLEKKKRENFKVKVNEVGFNCQISRVKCKVIPLEAWTGPEGSRKLRLQNLKIIGT